MTLAEMVAAVWLLTCSPLIEGPPDPLCSVELSDHGTTAPDYPEYDKAPANNEVITPWCPGPDCPLGT